MKTKGKPITVAVSGAFDPIHAGHIRYIQAAAKLGDRLVVILNGDDFLMKKKGFVFTPFAERKEILEAIKGVDEVIPSSDEDLTVSKTLEKVRPDIFAKGGSIGPQSIPEAETCLKIRCDLVTNVGGEIQVRPKDRAISIECPFCHDHPMLKAKCLHCNGVGRVDLWTGVTYTMT